MKITKSRIFARIGVVAMVVALVAPLAASAATVTSGNLTLGDSRPSQTSTYAFSASGFSTGTAIQCVQLRLNTAADGSGTAVGTTTGQSLSSNTLLSTGTWTVDNTQAGSLRITSAAGVTPNASGGVTWGGVVNGATPNVTYFAILNTYTGQNCSTGPTDTTVVAFMYKDGALVTMSVDPQLTFTVAGVTDNNSNAVNGQEVTVTSSASAIDFARAVTTSAKGVSAHDVTVATNSGGFAVYLKQSGNFSNGSHTITPWTGTNGTPTAFPALGTEAWGYTTEDATLTQFSANKWAGMPTTNELVVDSPTRASQTTRVGQQLGVSATTPAGNYSTTLVYTAAGTY